MRLLVIEDDILAANTLKDELRHLYVIDICTSGQDAEKLSCLNHYDVILLDCVLPDTDGFSLCELLRDNGIYCPILMLTGKSDTEEKIKGLDSGADDYLTKPYDAEELKARIRALTRRNLELGKKRILTVGDIVLDTKTKQVSRKNLQILLRRKELHLLEFLMRHAGQVVTRNMILEHVWESDSDPVTNTIDVHIKYLRDKLDKPFSSNLIRTIHGIGYKLEVH